ncbi:MULTISPECIES: RNA polymerase sigma factor [Cryobacterium]|uniref:RNA polymerase sigma factor n=1 Tax=Cryobacterium TaxID=69578 RepID=UPI000CD3FBBC|nr:MULTISPECIES: sigma-70 family RNA polymerase sigma factor [Cryobacterium]POH66029.1 RNA polymerase subunit sigma-70 [Cryobacterium zongtaii]TFC46698.1 sigma-70 family RNA polymerase sigma factor [Cryobacterium sp. TMN-39-2]
MVPDVIGQLLLENETDSVLVDFVVAGNQTAFEILVRRYRPMLHGYAMRTLGSNEESDDVVQEAFITAWEKLPALKDGVHLKAWLMRVVRNKCLDRLRKRRPVTVEIDENMPARLDSPFDVVETLLQNEALSLALSGLPTKQRRAWVMREFSGASYNVIASELGVPESTVRGLLARSRHTLARELAAWH